jgi:hypothetical protein
MHAYLPHCMSVSIDFPLNYNIILSLSDLLSKILAGSFYLWLIITYVLVISRLLQG